MPESLNSSDEVSIRIPIVKENIREEVSFIKDLKIFLKAYNKPTNDVDFIIKNLESNIDILSKNLISNEGEILKLIEKHPYFKNPCDYPIRLLTIIKYLKKRGINVNYKDIDIYIENLVQKIDGVKKVGRGLYIRNR